MAKKAYQDYSKLNRIVCVDENTNEILAEVVGKLINKEKITFLLNGLFQVYNGVIYLQNEGEKPILYKGIGGKKSFPDAKEIFE